MFFLKYIKTEGEYKSYIEGDPILPNVSLTIDDDVVHYTELTCEESTTYKVSNVSYSSEVDGDAETFQMSFDYIKTEINRKCVETVTEGSDTVDVYIGKNPSITESRTVEGVYDYHGTMIPYTVTQTGIKVEIIGNFNVTDTSSSTKILGSTTKVSEVYIDGVKQSSVTMDYTFSETGEHTVKYTLKDAGIGQSAFSGCTSLTSVTIPDIVTSIGSYAFSTCSSLTSVTIPNSVIILGNSAFRQCTSLTSVTIPNSVTTIGGFAFADCSGLTEVTIGSGVTRIEQAAFQECTSLTSVTTPNSVTYIGQGAFNSCSGLREITIGSGVTTITDNIFAYCSSLTSITSNATTAPTITELTFHNIKTGGTLTVPSGSSGYDAWMSNGTYYLGYYNWNKIEQ